MGSLALAPLVALACASLGIALLVIWAISRLDAATAAAGRAEARQEHPVAILLEGDSAVHTSKGARQILEAEGDFGPALWPEIYRAFHTRFPDMPATAEAAHRRAPLDVPAGNPADRAVLHFETIRGKLRIGLSDPVAISVAKRHIFIRQEIALRSINSATKNFPYPVWFQSGTGRLEWANPLYRAMQDPAQSKGAPIPQFDLPLAPGEQARTERATVTDPATGQARWFSVTRSQAQGGGSLNVAVGIDAVIEAEIAQRKFVQTLTKTFAQLSTGLAIFDRERQLALFNPALIDLLALPGDFLSARPTMLTFFDKLREKQMMPEPKNYTHWRQQITDLVVASVDGRYQDTWTLPSGLTYRVSGRPHPDGAIALLFEDISAEISLTRRFRAQLQLNQAVIDTLDEAIAVFSAAGALTTSNTAFRTLWKIDPEAALAEITFRDTLRQWKALARPGPFWERLSAYMDNRSDRSEWFADIAMKDGAPVECRVAPLTGGATLIGFRLRPVLGTKAGAPEEGAESGPASR